jgi:hypothetical protein
MPHVAQNSPKLTVGVIADTAPLGDTSVMQNEIGPQVNVAVAAPSPPRSTGITTLSFTSHDDELKNSQMHSTSLSTRTAVRGAWGARVMGQEWRVLSVCMLAFATNINVAMHDQVTHFHTQANDAWGVAHLPTRCGYAICSFSHATAPAKARSVWRHSPRLPQALARFQTDGRRG